MIVQPASSPIWLYEVVFKISNSAEERYCEIMGVLGKIRHERHADNAHMIIDNTEM